MLVEGTRHEARAAEDFDLEQAGLDGGSEVGDLLEQGVGLADFVRGLLEAALGGVDAPVAVVDVLLEVAQVVELEGVFGWRGEVFLFERLGMHFWAGSEVLLGVCEEVVRAGADEVGAAEFGVGDGELGRACGGRGAHELLCDVLVEGHCGM